MRGTIVGRQPWAPGTGPRAAGQHPPVANEKEKEKERSGEKSRHPSHLVDIKAESVLMAPAAGVSEALTAALCRAALGVRAVPGGVCGQQATGKLQGGARGSTGRGKKPPFHSKSPEFRLFLHRHTSLIDLDPNQGMVLPSAEYCFVTRRNAAVQRHSAISFVDPRERHSHESAVAKKQSSFVVSR
ncbi:hypothetical protein F2P81_024247 [Scophthalmus maximus]|uniref:Uncharacterized protein n=1 Tax=Scophthalmus maximus TaxID=52904 RepID=A0A6A4RTH1_SCOMX|nr:hypothetical protein F2P81_024247 [Scophthalmus maximus]